MQITDRAINGHKKSVWKSVRDETENLNIPLRSQHFFRQIKCN